MEGLAYRLTGADDEAGQAGTLHHEIGDDGGCRFSVQSRSQPHRTQVDPIRRRRDHQAGY